jgi:hypothetical protein
MGREYDARAKIESRSERLLLFLIFGNQKLDVADTIHSSFQMWEEVLDQQPTNLRAESRPE